METVILERYADVLLWALDRARGTTLCPEDIILLRYHTPALPLADILFEKILAKGGHPLVRTAMSPAMEKAFYGRGSDSQISFHAPGEEELFSSLNGSIYLHAPESLTHLAQTDPSRIACFARSRKPFKKILDKRDAQGLFGWTLCIYPTQELACQAGMDMDTYTEQLVQACFLDMENPVAHWQEILRKAEAIKLWLNTIGAEYFHVRSESCNLKIRVGKQRKWLGLSGHNIPSFELFISPDWRGTEGFFHADQISFRSGHRISGVRLEFSKGRVVKASAEEGERFLHQQLDTDEGARRIGEFSLTDRRFSRISRFMANTLFDENYGGRWGNCHIAIGSAYADSFTGDLASFGAEEKKQLGFNDSALHWDLVNTQPKTVEAVLPSGKRIEIYKDGMFLTP
ncbi:aminopeptidase [Desulfobotulus sp. H1]|uniref:Aminopeptidase n=1 Tax=Desulfobotulus pelophilus TaxID=2823377 RepID=A0ABT3N8E8_9BACT|nr:aminopeptidase [Desulfobotulus pelophilus]MCW7753731.1 aminopeptidase [Desulfobotulus pelophilus]